MVIGFAFASLLVGLGAWSAFAPRRMWRSMRRNRQWEYRDPATAQSLEPSERWLSRARTSGVYTLLLGLAAFAIVGWHATHAHKAAPRPGYCVTCDSGR